MLIEQALMTSLLGTAGITGYVGRRIYLVQAPQAVTKPYIVIEKMDSPEYGSHDGPAGLAYPRFSFSAYAVTYLEAKNISAALKTALDGYKNTMGGTGGLTVDIPQRDDEWDNYDAELKLYEVISEYTVWYKE